MSIEIYHRILRRLLRISFPVWQQLGMHITPNHYYQPIPDTRTLKEELWLKQSQLVGINMNEEAQLDLLGRFSSRFKIEYDKLDSDFPPVDAEVLYCMIRHFKPNRVFEIGSGSSTYLAAQAILRNKQNEGVDCELIAFEPYPSPTLKKGFPGLTRLVPSKIQGVPLKEFERLGANDILFIDSSHILKIGSDVQYEYLEILPRLQQGVIVHSHDIFLPSEYPRHWIKKLRLFWNEQYLLQAFLAFNDAFEVLWAGHHMNVRHPDKLQAAFASYSRKKVVPGDYGPGSFWIRKTK